MRKLFSFIALIALIFFTPVLIWGIKSAPYDSSLVLENRVGETPKQSGAAFALNYMKANAKVASVQDVDSTMDQLKAYDAIYVTTEDGFSTTVDQWNTVKVNIDQNRPTILFAEYGAIQNTEPGPVADQIAQDLGVEASGWSGLFVEDLENYDSAIPDRVYDYFGDNWNFSGPGLVLNNDVENVTHVVEIDTKEEELTLDLITTDKGREEGFKEARKPYSGWFDIVSPTEDTEVMYTFDIPLSDEVKEKFDELDIPETIPAVTKHRNGASHRFYMAGTFSQSEAIPLFYQFQGLPRLYSVFDRFSSSSFYWNSYFPIISQAMKLHADFSEGLGAEFAAVANENEGDIRYPARMNYDLDRIEINVDGQWEPTLVKGVNLGMASPGHFPGEAGITEGEYYEWFKMIAEMNANTIRVYTLHPPGFYRALAKYNAEHEDKVYVFHGVWINEDWITGDADAFHEEAVQGFRQEIEHVVDALHGNVIVEHVPGHASGVYATDVSDYVIGWVIGTEWDPFMVKGTNEKHQDVGDFNGTYYETKDANPMEYWIASHMEYVTDYEISNYNEIRPMSFTNWVTTDILHHPSDDSNKEDISEINPNHIYTKGIMDEVGQFASYHVYPYYPDFLYLDKKYLNKVDHRGEQNTYYGYLQELRSVHNMPVLVAEFGVPSSRGRTHTGPMGMHQGSVSEQEQGEYIQRMFEDMLETNYMGGLIFTWQDEWFKRTWNTMDFDNPDRRPYWSNRQTSEQQFGLLSFDPDKIKVDGDVKDWEGDPLYVGDKGDPIQAAYVDHDEAYLYLRLDLDDSAPSTGYPVALIDTIQGQGNHGINKFNATSDTAADFLLSLEEDESRVMVDANYEMHSYYYGWLYGYMDINDHMFDRNSGEFLPIKYVLNGQMKNAETGEIYPFEDYETGFLREGNGNPEADDFYSLTDYSWSADRKQVEVRIPWLLLSFKDPSRKEIVGDFVTKEDIRASDFLKDIGFSFMYVQNETPVQSLPESNSGSTVGSMKRYTWENWDMVEVPFPSRLKQSYFHVQDYFATLD